MDYYIKDELISLLGGWKQVTSKSNHNHNTTDIFALLWASPCNLFLALSSE